MFFFFQAEDGIRDKLVTGVQTCALPIWKEGYGTVGHRKPMPDSTVGFIAFVRDVNGQTDLFLANASGKDVRSEERRVGKRVELGGGGMIQKKSEEREDRTTDGKVVR